MATKPWVMDDLEDLDWDEIEKVCEDIKVKSVAPAENKNNSGQNFITISSGGDNNSSMD